MSFVKAGVTGLTGNTETSTCFLGSVSRLLFVNSKWTVLNGPVASLI